MSSWILQLVVGNFVTRATQRNEIRVGVILRSAIRNNVMNIKGAPVLFGRFPAMFAHLVASPNLLGALHPKGKIFKVAGKFARVFSEVVVNILALVPIDFALARAEATAVFFTSLSAQFAGWKRLTGGVNKALATTVNRSVVPEFRLEQLATGWTRFGGWFARANSVTRLRAIFGLTVPVLHGRAGLLNDSFFASGAWFSLPHNDNYTTTRQALQGNT